MYQQIIHSVDGYLTKLIYHRICHKEYYRLISNIIGLRHICRSLLINIDMREGVASQYDMTYSKSLHYLCYVQKALAEHTAQIKYSRDKKIRIFFI
jgi:hypothetical protein